MQELFNGVLDHPFWGRGFRPFFLLAALYGAVCIFIWGGFYAGYVTPPVIFSDSLSWHAYEMIYGFSMAVIAGFLLTAVANWTGGAPARQLHLAGLCGLWLVGRAVANFDFGLSVFSQGIIEGSFIPALALSLAIPLLKSWNKRNFIFLALLIILFACDVCFWILQTRAPLYGAVMVIVAMISLVGGRIIPAFTVAALRRRGSEVFQTDQYALDAASVISLFLVILSILFLGTQNIVFSVCAFIAAILHAARMRHYHTWKILDDPMVWILHAGYGWVVAGLFLMGVSGIGFINFSTAMHALTAGAIGSMTLGMMCRVSLGHTGRNLTSTRGTTLSFFLMQIAGFVRVFGSLALPEATQLCIVISACLWSVCFAFYVFIYTPMLLKPRSDGRPA